MIAIRKSQDRGRAELGWLDSRHSFSFGRYYDPAHMGFGRLRVINEDRVAPGAGFPRHAHDNMEILSYVLEGALEHKDSIGTGSVIGAGDLQRMSAGSGIEHSEFNHSKTQSVHFLQIWIVPEVRDIEPGYEQRNFAAQGLDGLVLAASRDGREGSVRVHQDASLYLGRLKAEGGVSHPIGWGRLAWLQVLRGSVAIGGHLLTPGDGAALKDEPAIAIGAHDEAEFLLFDLRA